MTLAQQKEFMHTFVKNQSSFIYSTGWTWKDVRGLIDDQLQIVYDKIRRAVDLATELQDTTSVSAGAPIAAGDPIPAVTSGSASFSVFTASSIPAATPIAAGVSTTAGAFGSASEVYVLIIELLDSPPKDTSLPLDSETEEHDTPFRKSSRKKSIARKNMTGDRSQLINFMQKFLGTVKFRNDHVAKIMGQFCDSDLEVAFRQHSCFIRNLEGVDLLTGSRGNNLYTLSLQDMTASSPIYIWDNVKMLLEGFELTKENRESQLYDDFEQFRQHKGESIHDYYVRFAKLINDMRNIKMTMSRMQLNSKFVNNMLPKWGRFVMAIKLNRGLRDSNYDQLYAYLKQHETHAKENKMMLERFS
nr:integrase, catalytic region, zinc finger, CCHC-type, peptidase aspartic, catalytic [Tanacetum cinerariifolium]